MTTATFNDVHVDHTPKRGILARMLDRMAEAQLQRARGVAKHYLLALSDEDLHALGHRREEIARWPSGPRWL